MDKLKRYVKQTGEIATEVIGDMTYSYSYDAIGNIIQISILKGTETKVIDYEYDANSQLVREDNEQLNKTITYSYDDSRNLLNKKEYV